MKELIGGASVVSTAVCVLIILVESILALEYLPFFKKYIYNSFSMYFFERTLVRVLPTHTVSGPGGGGSEGARRWNSLSWAR